MIKLLWIDDNLDHDLTEKRITLVMEEDIDSHFARDATEAYYRLRKDKFDVVIVDLQLPPGPDDMWNGHREKGFQKFGAALLELVRKPDNEHFGHLSRTQFGVFTIEPREENPELFDPPISLPDENFKVKTHAASENAFLDFIRKVHKP